MTINPSRQSFSLSDRFTQQEGRIYLTAMQALARVLMDQHRADARKGLNTAGLISGYPGSPLGGLDIELGRQKKVLAEHNIRFLPGLNEELAATALFGSQMLEGVGKAKVDGVFGMWFGKAPGLDRSGDALRHANIRGVGKNGGMLVLAGDDPHPISSMFPSDSNVAFYDFDMPILFPGDVQEILDLGLHGYALSRASGLWIGFKIVSSVADSAGTAMVGEGRIAPVSPVLEVDGHAFTPTIRLNEAGAPMREAERDLHNERIEIARRYGYENELNRTVVSGPDDRLGLVAAGKTYFDLRQALTNLGLSERDLNELGVRILKLTMPYPLHPQTVSKFAEGLEEILIIEEKRAFVELFIKDMLYGRPNAPLVVGKKDETGAELLRSHDELDADIVSRAVANRLLKRHNIVSVSDRLAFLDRVDSQPMQLSTNRAPYFCSGCPHNRSMVTPDGTVVGAGIGCHVMALYMGKEGFGNVIGYTQMGGEGAQWVGLQPFTGDDHFVQNLGDGTFNHSGSLAIRFAVASGANITYKLLYNQAVSMTGGQQVTGAKDVPALTQLLQAEGVSKVIVTTDDLERYRDLKLASNATLRHRDELLEAEKELIATPGVTVLLHDQQCAAEKRRLRKRGQLATPVRSVHINERVCEGCGDCGRKSNCLSVQPIETEFGRKTQIHQSSCNKDFSCMMGDCPSFLTVDALPLAVSHKKAIPEIARVAPPTPGDFPGGFALTMMGIGGTGVVTVNQIIATAAVLDGRAVRSLDITGFSQKAGPVVSELQIIADGSQTSNMVTAGSTDLYLVFDPLVAVDPTNLAKASAERTVAVMSTSKVPTGRMVADVGTSYPDMSLLRARIDRVTRNKDNVHIDAQRLATEIIGDHMAGNIVMVGAAYQAGQLPVSAESIEQAILLNGAAVDMNIAAFRLGCLAVAEPQTVEAMLGAEHSPAPRAELPPRLARLSALVEGSEELKRVVDLRIRELAEYQDAAYAEKYARFIAQIQAAEARATPGHEEVATAVARNLYKLMAFKDEYEVARLLLDEAQSQEMAERFGPDVRPSYHLHPSFLRRLGVRNKVKLGPWFVHVLKMLRYMKRLRGTPFDLIGRDPMRRAERALIAHYRDMMEHAVASMDTENHVLVAELAGLPDIIRGYENVKVGTISRYFDRVDEVCGKLNLGDSRPPTEVATLGKAA